MGDYHSLHIFNKICLIHICDRCGVIGYCTNGHILGVKPLKKRENSPEYIKITFFDKTLQRISREKQKNGLLNWQNMFIIEYTESTCLICTEGKMKNRKIVVVSENERLIEQFAWQLELKGYKHIECFNDSLEALRALANKKHKADVVISSVIMPKCDGVKLVRTLKKYNICRDTVFLGILPYISDEVASIALKAGFDYVADVSMTLENLVATMEIAFRVKTGDRVVAKADLLNPINCENMDCEEYIKHVLLRMGISKKYEGFNYILSGIKMYVECADNVRLKITKDVYPRLASIYNTTVRAIERDMRYAIYRAWLTGDINMQSELFGYSCNNDNGCPSNKEYLTMVAEHIRMRLKK